MRKSLFYTLSFAWVGYLYGCAAYLAPHSVVSGAPSAVSLEEKEELAKPQAQIPETDHGPTKTDVAGSSTPEPAPEELEKNDQSGEKTSPDEVAPEIAGPTIEEIIRLEESALASGAAVDGEKSSEDGAEPHPVRFTLPVVDNPRVHYFVNHFCEKERAFFEQALSRSGRYVPMMREILREADIPEDFVYLALIESGFSPHAYSRARAVGPWQFMYRTALRYGLKISHWIDERRDPVKATRAAAAYLKDLYDQFGKWFLAAAAYNAGETKVGRAIRRYRSHDIWHLSQKPYLRRETRNFVPKFMAATLLVREPEKCGFENVTYEPPMEYDEVRLGKAISLQTAAELADTTVKTIKTLNPSLRRDITPPDIDGFVLRVPPGKGEAFQQAYERLPESKKIGKIIIYKIRPGDTLSKIASRFGQTVKQIMKTNNLRSSRIRAGHHLTIIFDGHAR